MRTLLRKSHFGTAVVAACFIGAVHALVAGLEPFVEQALFHIINFFGFRTFRGDAVEVFPFRFPWQYYAGTAGMFVLLAVVGSGLLWWFFGTRPHTAEN